MSGSVLVRKEVICSVSRQISLGFYLSAFFTVFLVKTQILGVFLLLFLFIDENKPFRKFEIRPVNPHKPRKMCRVFIVILHGPSQIPHLNAGLLQP